MRKFEVVVKNKDIETHREKFETLLQANAWIALHNHDKGAFGKVGEFTTQVNDLTSEVEEQELLENLEKSGIETREFCQKVLNVIIGFNKSKTMTSAEIQSMISDYSQPKALLEDGMPTTAKPLIEALVPQTDTMTELKNLVIKLYTESDL